jgi:hypothetical protein
MNKKNAARSTLAVLVALLAGACTTIDSHVRVDDWPALKIVEHRVSYDAMYERCKKYVGLLSTPLGCTEFYFAAGEAHIYVTPELPLSQKVLEHERLHAAGFDHVGSDAMARLWRDWQAGQRRAAAGGQGGVAASQFLP